MGVTKPGRLAQWYNYLNSSDAITRYCIPPQASNNFLDESLTATPQSVTELEHDQKIRKTGWS
jgi:hypothetical protein